MFFFYLPTVPTSRTHFYKVKFCISLSLSNMKLFGIWLSFFLLRMHAKSFYFFYNCLFLKEFISLILLHPNIYVTLFNSFFLYLISLSYSHLHDIFCLSCFCVIIIYLALFQGRGYFYISVTSIYFCIRYLSHFYLWATNISFFFFLLKFLNMHVISLLHIDIKRMMSTRILRLFIMCKRETDRGTNATGKQIASYDWSGRFGGAHVKGEYANMYTTINK